MQILSFPLDREKRENRRKENEPVRGDCGQGLAVSILQLNLYCATQPSVIRAEPSVRTLGFILLGISDKNLVVFLMPNDAF